MPKYRGAKWGGGIGPRYNKPETEKNNEKMGTELKEKCSLCGKMFKKKPFERNAFCWVMQHTETPTYEKASWVCPECKNQLNLFMTKVLMGKRKWTIIGIDLASEKEESE